MPACPAVLSYSTSGASEIIRIKPLSLSSLATGPNMRVPLGSLALLITTAALSSNRSTLPSGRWMSSLGPHDHTSDNLALFDSRSGPRRRLLNRADNDVSNPCIMLVGTAHHAYTHDLARTGIVRGPEPRVRLYHLRFLSRLSSGKAVSYSSRTATPTTVHRGYYYLAFSTIRDTRHRFSREIGLVSIISTVSPTPHSFSSSCALNLLVRRTILP